MKNRVIFDFLNERFPVETASDFDNPGFLVGNEDDDVKGILVALDCDFSAINEAEKNGCNLIVTHHPVIFNPLKKVLAKSIVYELIRAGISVISMHTNLDIGENGVADCICLAAGFKNIEKYIAKDGFILRKATVSPISSDKLADRLKTVFDTPIRYLASDKPIEKILICPGSGGGYTSEAAEAGFDALITGDIKHSSFVEADNAGLALFDIGHFSGEDIVIEPMAEIISGAFSSVIPVYTFHSKRLKWSV